MKTNKRALKRQARVRGKLHGTAVRPRLTVDRYNRFTYLQVINDDKGVTLAAANDKTLAKVKAGATAGTKLERATLAATTLAEELKKQKVTKLSFDRGSYRYHGRVKAIADAMRNSGIEV